MLCATITWKNGLLHRFFSDCPGAMLSSERPQGHYFVFKVWQGICFFFFFFFPGVFLFNQYFYIQSIFHKKTKSRAWQETIKETSFRQKLNKMLKNKHKLNQRKKKRERKKERIKGKTEQTQGMEVLCPGRCYPNSIATTGITPPGQ